MGRSAAAALLKDLLRGKWLREPTTPPSWKVGRGWGNIAKKSTGKILKKMKLWKKYHTTWKKTKVEERHRSTVSKAQIWKTEVGIRSIPYSGEITGVQKREGLKRDQRHVTEKFPASGKYDPTCTPKVCRIYGKKLGHPINWPDNRKRGNSCKT